MNEMLERLDEAQRAQRRFVADSSHELRSPLATLAAAVELATADPSSAAWRELSPVMAAEITRMGRLVEDLLLLAKVDEHTMRLHVGGRRPRRPGRRRDPPPAGLPRARRRTRSSPRSGSWGTGPGSARRSRTSPTTRPGTPRSTVRLSLSDGA